MSQSITLEQVEVLAATLQTEEAGRRERLLRLIRAEARIIAVREPSKFKARAVEISDEDGHYDNSYPPDIKHKDFSGPRLVRVRPADYDTVATSEGFYHEWRPVTSDRGLYVARDGTLYGADYSGEGSYGQFAAHPGNCGVRIVIEWERLDLDDVDTDELVMVEEALRDLAFPLATQAGVGEVSHA